MCGHLGLELPELFGSGRMAIDPRSTWSIPGLRARQSDQSRTDRPQTGPALFRQCVGDHSGVAERLRRTFRLGVEERARVARAICRNSDDFGRLAVIERTRDGTPDDRDPDDDAIMRCGDCELAALRRLVMSMHARNVRACVTEADGT